MSFHGNEDYNNPCLDNKDHDENNYKLNLLGIEENGKPDNEIESDRSKTSEISSYISEENCELTDDDKEFKETETTNINDGTVNTMLLICNFDINNNK